MITLKNKSSLTSIDYVKSFNKITENKNKKPSFDINNTIQTYSNEISKSKINNNQSPKIFSGKLREQNQSKHFL